LIYFEEVGCTGNNTTLKLNFEEIDSKMSSTPSAQFQGQGPQRRSNNGGGRGGRGSSSGGRGGGRGRGGGGGTSHANQQGSVAGHGGGGGGGGKSRNRRRPKKNNDQQGTQEAASNNINDKTKKSTTKPNENPSKQVSGESITSSANPNPRRRRQKNNKKKKDGVNTDKAVETAKSDAPKKQEKPTEEEIRLAEEKKANEARIEAERKAQEEARKKEEERKQKIKVLEDEIRSKISNLGSIVDITNQHCFARKQLTKETLVQTRKDFQDSKKKLKSDLKKCTAFCKKIKSSPKFESQTVASLLKDVKSLNLTRYIEEIANAFVECKMKVVDVPGAVEVCVELHKRYEDFMPTMLPRIMGNFSSKSGSTSTSTPDDAKQKRIYLRFLIELFVVGVLSEVKSIMKIVVDASGANNADGDNYHVVDANMVVSFGKAAGHEIIGVIPKSVAQDIEFLNTEISKDLVTLDEIKDDADVKSESASNGDADESGANNQAESTEMVIVAEPAENTPDKEDQVRASPLLLTEASDMLRKVESALNEHAATHDICERFHKHLSCSFKSLSSSYVVNHKKLVKLEKRCDQDRLLAGALSEQREKGLNDARKLMDALRKSVESLSETLNVEVPVLAADDDEVTKDEGAGIELYKSQDDRISDLGPFDDEETKEFYCDIPDLLSTIPPTLLGYTPEEIEKKQEVNRQKYGSGFDEADSSDDPGEFNESGTEPQDFEDDNSPADVVEGETDTTEGNENKDAPQYKLKSLLEQELPECNRRDKVDEIAEKFCTNHGTSKSSKKRLQRSLFCVPRSRLDLLPYYSRLAAIFERVFPDIAGSLVTDLEQQFHGLARWKKQQNLENRLRNARFIGELTKFRVAPPIVALRGLRRCLDDFSGYNIDVACCLLESCGRYLYRTKHTSAKISHLMDTMKRIRKMKHFDERNTALLNSAFYMVQPPQTNTRKDVKTLSPLEAYLKDLLIVRLGTMDASITFVSKQILRCPWSDLSLDFGSLLVKYLLKTCRKGRYNSVNEVVSLISNLRKTKPEILARTIDTVSEELQYTIENPSIRDQQRAIIYAKLLGEMHCQALVSGAIIFTTLLNLINFDHEIPEGLRMISSDKNTAKSNNLLGPLAVTGTIKEDEEMEEEELHSESADNHQAPVAVSVHSKHDPRVPSTNDPDSAVFRIKLICTLLDSSAACLVTNSNISKVERFMAAFQRYLFIKQNLSTDIEFSILDTFDIIDSKLKAVRKTSKKTSSLIRYKTWIEAHTVVVADDELESIADEKSTQRLLSQAGVNVDGENGSIGDVIGCDDADESVDDESSLMSHENENIEHGSLNSFSDSEESIDGGQSLDDESEEENEDEVEDEIDDESEDDDESFENEELDEVAVQEAYSRKLEDEAFEQEIRKLTMEALEKGKNTARTVASAKVSDTMPSASQFARKKASESNTASPSNSTFALGGESGMAFKLIKRGHKGRVEAKELVVPSDTNLAKIVTKQDHEAAKERDMLKARVLQYEAESAEQSFSNDVYMDQTRFPEVRNNQRLTMEDINRNFGSSKGSVQVGRGGRDRDRGNRTLWRS